MFLKFLLPMLFLVSPLPGADGEWLKIPVNEDTWISAYGREKDGSNGGSSLLKLKGIQEFLLLKCRLESLQGRVIKAVELHLTPLSPARPLRLSISSLASPWQAGDGTGYALLPGAATFAMAAHGQRPWAFPGSDITAVILGCGNTIWNFADPETRGKKLVYAVHPRVMSTLVAGISHGLCVIDDIGSEYERSGDQFKYLLFRNRYVGSCNSQSPTIPFFRVLVGKRDKQPPARITRITVKDDELPPGQVELTWTTPPDRGKAGTIGFSVVWCKGSTSKSAKASSLPQWLVPMAGKAGDKVTMRLRDLGLQGGEQLALGIRPLDGAGNIGPLTRITMTLPRSRPVKLPPAPKPQLPMAGTVLPRVAGMEVAVVDGLDKYSPTGEKSIPPHAPGYLLANHLWSAKDKVISFTAARNEFISCQLLFRGTLQPVTATAKFPVNSGVRPVAEFFTCHHVQSTAGKLPDPLVPAPKGLLRPQDLNDKAYSALFELYVPHTMAKGLHHGTLSLAVGTHRISLPLKLKVLDFTLPDHLSFIPEMNCYNLPPPPREIAYYRLAHQHRTNLNRLLYGWRGHKVVCPPGKKGNDFDFTAWDRRFGPLFDGSAFADLPRGPIPVDSFYLPLNEDWPLRVAAGFKGGYWADQAFKPAYAQGFQLACRAFASHIRKKGWGDTLFQFYLNNKVYNKKNDWNRSSAPWVFDEPVNTQDFFALRWFGSLFHAAVLPESDGVKPVFRCDISRPQWQRGLLDGLLDVNVCGTAFHRYHRRVLERRARFGEITFIYGSTSPVSAPATGPLAWCIHSWASGVDGVLPWQTVGKLSSWREADRLSLFYPGDPVGRKGPVASLRLKAFRRGQQDIEYLTLLKQVLDRPRFALAEAVLKRLGLERTAIKVKGEEAGKMRFQPIAPLPWWQLRQSIGTMLDQIGPPAKKRLVDFNPPKRDPNRLPGLLHPQLHPGKTSR